MKKLLTLFLAATILCSTFVLSSAASDTSCYHSPGMEATCTTAQTCNYCGEVLVEALGHASGNDNVCDICGKTVGAEGIEYELSEDGTYYIVVGYAGTSNTLIIPSVYMNKPVKEIADSAFYLCENLTSVTIPDSVATICSWAFCGCTSLTNITIPNSVTRIEGAAFCGCKSLESIIIPDSVTSIGSDAFNGCDSLIFNQYDTGCYLGNDNNPYHCLVTASSAYIVSCDIHENTKLILSSAFSYCKFLMSVTIPDSVTSIGNSAFYFCENLTSITIPDSVTSIEDVAFAYCTSLTSITIPDSVTSIEDSAFDHCENLTNVTIPDSVTSIGQYAFYGCTSLTSITIPNSVTSIEFMAFYLCASLTSITIPSSVTSMGGAVFDEGCSSLETIYCEAESMPTGWIEFWNISNAVVHWGHVHFTDSGTPCAEYRLCSECGVVFVGHTPGAGATCTDHQTCTECGDILIEALGHAEGEWEIITQPTTEKEGLQEKHCTVCGALLKYQTIPVIILGDIDGSADIDYLDYILLKRACMGSYELTDMQKTSADVHADNAVDYLDYILLKRVCMGTYTIA